VTDIRYVLTVLCPSPSGILDLLGLRSPGTGWNWLVGGMLLPIMSIAQRLHPDRSSFGRPEVFLLDGGTFPKTRSWSLRCLRIYGSDGIKGASWKNFNGLIFP
jgi:hypothetical protein